MHLFSRNPFEVGSAREPIWDPGVFTIIIIFFPYWWLSYNNFFYLSISQVGRNTADVWKIPRKWSTRSWRQVNWCCETLNVRTLLVFSDPAPWWTRRACVRVWQEMESAPEDESKEPRAGCIKQSRRESSIPVPRERPTPPPSLSPRPVQPESSVFPFSTGKPRIAKNTYDTVVIFQIGLFPNCCATEVLLHVIASCETTG